MKILTSPDDGQGAGGGAGGQGGEGISQTAQSLFGGGESASTSGDTGGEQGGSGGASGSGAELSGQGGQAQGGSQAGAQSQAQSQQGNALSLDAIKQLAAELRGTSQPRVQEPPPQLTSEEFNRLFNVYNPGEELIQALRAEDPQVTLGALQQAFQSVVKQATTVAAFHTLQEMEKMRQMVGPALQFAQAQQLEGMKNEFFQQHPDLKGMEPLLLQIRDSFIARNRQFDKKEDAFKAVADEARAILSKITGLNGGQQSTGQSGQQAGQQRQRQMPALSGKGQGGGGQGGSASPKNTAERIFGPR